MIGWAALDTWLARGGTYDAAAFLSLLPGLWLPLVPFVLAGSLLVLPVVRTGLSEIASPTPAHRLLFNALGAVSGLRRHSTRPTGQKI